MPTAQVNLRAVSPWTERRAQPITGIRQHATEAHTGGDYTIDLRKSHLWLCPCHSISAGTPARFNRA